MKTNKSRRIKRQSRFRNTRSKRKSIKRQRGGDLEAADIKFNGLLKEDQKNIKFEFKGSNFTGFIEKNRPNQLYINRIQPTSDKNYTNLISSFGYGGNFITIKTPSSYWSKNAAIEIINSIEYINSPPVNYGNVEFYR